MLIDSGLTWCILFCLSTLAVWSTECPVSWMATEAIRSVSNLKQVSNLLFSRIQSGLQLLVLYLFAVCVNFEKYKSRDFREHWYLHQHLQELLNCFCSPRSSSVLEGFWIKLARCLLSWDFWCLRITGSTSNVFCYLFCARHEAQVWYPHNRCYSSMLWCQQQRALPSAFLPTAVPLPWCSLRLLALVPPLVPREESPPGSGLPRGAETPQPLLRIWQP